MLSLKCKSCGEAFSAGIQMDEQSFETATLENNAEQCPNGHTEKYDKSDYFFSE